MAAMLAMVLATVHSKGKVVKMACAYQGIFFPRPPLSKKTISSLQKTIIASKRPDGSEEATPAGGMSDAVSSIGVSNWWS